MLNIFEQTLPHMKHLALIFKCLLLIIFPLVLSQKASACNSFFTHTNACVGDTVWFHPIDNYALYTWHFGDNTPGATNVSFDSVGYHVYTQPGTYYVTLFTNVGAEWDYYTTAITIGNDCFKADFSSTCYGNTTLYFTDNSIGNPNSWTWNFGDPASGVNNTSTLQSPSHMFSGPGTYVVTLLMSDGTQTDTVQHSVSVSSSCISASPSWGIWQVCAGTVATPYPNYSGNITSYLWNFGDPSSGVNNTSNLANPTHVFSAPGIYITTLTISNGNETVTYTICMIVVECNVWPGDCNQDGEVNGDDLLPLGIYFGKTGVPRNNNNTTWAAQTSTTWQDFSQFMYLQRLVTGDHADVNGDGTINANDIAGISSNFGKKHQNNNNLSEMLFVDPTDPWLEFGNVPVQIAESDIVNLPILLGVEDTARRIYGYSLVIEYDTNIVVPSSVNIITNSGWLGTSGTDLISLFANDNKGHAYISAVRTNQITKNGIGAIANMSFQVRNHVLSGDDLHLAFRQDSKVISNGMMNWQNNQQASVPVNLGESQIQVSSTFGLEEQKLNNPIKIFPNPATESITVSWANVSMNEIQIIDLTGKMIATYKINQSGMQHIDISTLSKGAYMMKCVSDTGTTVNKFLKQ